MRTVQETLIGAYGLQPRMKWVRRRVRIQARESRACGWSNISLFRLQAVAMKELFLQNITEGTVVPTYASIAGVRIPAVA